MLDGSTQLKSLHLFSNLTQNQVLGDVYKTDVYKTELSNRRCLEEYHADIQRPDWMVRLLQLRAT